MGQLHVELVAADGKVWEGDASQVIARGVEGDLGILPRHAPLMTVLQPGHVRIDADGGRHDFEVDGGFLTVDSDNVTIVSETARTS
ncbi:F0F1 ATP synthase subunit epsilon [Gephyromycinifex aptenodytis]|uniref:F0F1 ATP synthase subunit epsilon n=1 Tax=Gephyromycinifex aptenodytis TaxID=2716227 RepID=UPI00144843EF|nr:F0F1 ATP synthase subunit epsilon [Gephyromycinifex aptenodytis]